jgi:probable rRNA maturation factor
VGVRIENRHPRGRVAARRLRRKGAAYLRRLGQGKAELSVLLVTDGIIRTLNRRWRGNDRSTDVLSFGRMLPAPPGTPPLLGDVVISFDTAARRARGDRRIIGLELDRYLAHGLLHLLGYDHQRPREARRMAAKEDQLASATGLVGAALRLSDGSRRRRPTGDR